MPTIASFGRLLCLFLCLLIIGCGGNNAPPPSTVPTNAPVANAGRDQTAVVNETVTLDGSESYDVDGDTLTLAWALITKPSGSAANLSNATAVRPTFLVDTPGEYIFQLVVDDGLETSDPSDTTISTIQSVPVSDAGADQYALIGERMTLDGSRSADFDVDQLDFQWSLISIPAGSNANLSDSTLVNPEFDVDKPGTYVGELVVSDGAAASSPDQVRIETVNTGPVANAGPDQSVNAGSQIQLDGSDSLHRSGTGYCG